MKDKLYLVRRLLLSGEYDCRVAVTTTTSPYIFADVICKLTEHFKDYSSPTQE